MRPVGSSTAGRNGTGGGRDAANPLLCMFFLVYIFPSLLLRSFRPQNDASLLLTFAKFVRFVSVKICRYVKKCIYDNESWTSKRFVVAGNVKKKIRQDGRRLKNTRGERKIITNSIIRERSVDRTPYDENS